MAVIYTQSDLSKDEAEALDGGTAEFLAAIETRFVEDQGFWLMGEVGDDAIDVRQGRNPDVQS